jgi:hypothetical protein
MMLFGSDIVKLFKLSGEEDDAEDRQRQDRRFESFVEKKSYPVREAPTSRHYPLAFPSPYKQKQYSLHFTNV